MPWMFWRKSKKCLFWSIAQANWQNITRSVYSFKKKKITGCTFNRNTCNSKISMFSLGYATSMQLFTIISRPPIIKSQLFHLQQIKPCSNVCTANLGSYHIISYHFPFLTQTPSVPLTSSHRYSSSSSSSSPSSRSDKAACRMLLRATLLA